LKYFGVDEALIRYDFCVTYYPAVMAALGWRVKRTSKTTIFQMSKNETKRIREKSL
jgi:hypothetical protein